jgi:hypothetical protein
MADTIEYTTATGARGDGRPLVDPIGRKAKLIAESEARNSGLSAPRPERIAELRADFEARAGGPVEAFELPGRQLPSDEENAAAATRAVNHDEAVVFDHGRHIAVPDRFLERTDVEPSDARFERADGYGCTIFAV